MESITPVDADVKADGSVPKGYLEVLSRSGRVVNRIAVTGGDILIGRGYDNDLILDDPYVCSQHARVSWVDGVLRVTDLNSTNGLSTGNRDYAEILTLACDDQMRIGRTLIRYRSSGYQVPTTQADHRAINPFRVLERPLFQTMVFAVATVLTLLEAYFDSVTKVEPLKFVPSVVVMLVMISVWSMLWAFASRLVLQKWRFLTHCAVALSGFVLIQFSGISWGYFSFAFGVNSGENLYIYLTSTLFLGVLIFLHLHFATAAPWQKLARTATGIAIVVIGLVVAVNLANKADFSSSPEYDVALKAPAFKLTGNRTSTEFFQEVEQMLVRVDADAAEDANN